jgi:hypothetical protein
MGKRWRSLRSSSGLMTHRDNNDCNTTSFTVVRQTPPTPMMAWQHEDPVDPVRMTDTYDDDLL